MRAERESEKGKLGGARRESDGTERAGAVEERDGAGRRAAISGSDHGREGNGLAVGRRIGVGAERGGGTGLRNRLRRSGGGAYGETGVAAVFGGDGVRAERERGEIELRGVAGKIRSAE